MRDRGGSKHVTINPVKGGGSSRFCQVWVCVCVLRMPRARLRGPSGTLRARTAAIGTPQPNSCVCTGRVRTNPGLLGPRGSGALPTHTCQPTRSLALRTLESAAALRVSPFDVFVHSLVTSAYVSASRFRRGTSHIAQVGILLRSYL